MIDDLYDNAFEGIFNDLLNEYKHPPSEYGPIVEVDDDEPKEKTTENHLPRRDGQDSVGRNTLKTIVDPNFENNPDVQDSLKNQVYFALIPNRNNDDDVDYDEDVEYQPVKLVNIFKRTKDTNKMAKSNRSQYLQHKSSHRHPHGTNSNYRGNDNDDGKVTNNINILTNIKCDVVNNVINNGVTYKEKVDTVSNVQNTNRTVSNSSGNNTGTVQNSIQNNVISNVIHTKPK